MWINLSILQLVQGLRVLPMHGTVLLTNICLLDTEPPSQFMSDMTWTGPVMIGKMQGRKHAFYHYAMGIVIKDQWLV